MLSHGSFQAKLLGEILLLCLFLAHARLIHNGLTAARVKNTQRLCSDRDTVHLYEEMPTDVHLAALLPCIMHRASCSEAPVRGIVMRQ